MKARLLPVIAAATLFMALAAGCGDDSSDSKASNGGTELVGLFRFTPGTCDGGTIGGSWFRMVQPGGTVEAGPYVQNGDSTCPDQGVTVLKPGADGGLKAGSYQPQPDPPFTAEGGSAAVSVIEPQGFFAVAFGISTNQTDPQTGKSVPAPRIAANGGTLTGDLSAFSASWNGQHFNQGAPKPGAEGEATGTYDEATKAYTLDWTSLIEGGPFNGFTGVWHFEGTFEPT